MWLRQLASVFRNGFLTGVLVLAPAGAVLWILLWLWDSVMSLSTYLPSDLMPHSILSGASPFWIGVVETVVNIFLLAIVVLGISAVGFFSKNFFFRKVFELIERTVSRVPVLSAVYSTLDQLLKTFASGKKGNFRRVVLIEYPRKGIQTMALVTSERSNGTLTVFVPTTPNPTSGFYLILPSSEVQNLDISVEEALKEIISMGLVRGTSVS